MNLSAHLAFINGNIITMEEGMPQATALALYGGKIVFVGNDQDVQSFILEQTEVIDLQGKTLLPGFIDAHTHLLRTGMEKTLYVDLEAPSLDELFQKVEASVKDREAGQWVVGRGWDESQWNTSDYPSKDDLDKIAPNHPLVLIRICGHIVSVNSKALEMVPVKDNPETVDRSNGWLREESAWGFLDQIDPDLEDRLKALEAGIAHAHSCGITTIHEIADWASVQTYMTLQKQRKLNLRVRLNVLHKIIDHFIDSGIQGEFGNKFLSIAALKMFADGSIGARNAALFQPYTDDTGNDGVLNYKQSDLEQWMRKGHENGFQLMTHAIGDRAIEAVIDAYEAVGVTAQNRARIEHLEMPTNTQLERMEKRQIIASMQPNFVQWSGPGKLYEQRLGVERDSRIDPHRRVLNHNVPLAFSSDSMPVNVLHGLHQVVNAPHEDQRLSVMEALHAYTLGGAYARFDEHYLGSLKVGKRADLVVFDRNPLEAADQLDQLNVEQTYVAGQRVK